jgi:hypothetical protein
MACNALFPPTDNAPLTTVRAGNERLFKLVHAQILKLEPTLANAAALNSSPLIPSIRNADSTVSSFGKLTVERSIVVMLYAVLRLPKVASSVGLLLFNSSSRSRAAKSISIVLRNLFPTTDSRARRAGFNPSRLVSAVSCATMDEESVTPGVTTPSCCNEGRFVSCRVPIVSSKGRDIDERRARDESFMVPCTALRVLLDMLVRPVAPLEIRSLVIVRMLSRFRGPVKEEEMAREPKIVAEAAATGLVEYSY